MLFRRTATILLLTFLLFNWVGYWLFISWFESRETARWETRLDHEQYDAGQLILFTMPADVLPYSNASANFERADGEIQVGDIHYRYVSKRLYNDSIEFLCIPDQEDSRLQSAKSDIFQLAAGIPDNGHHKTSAKASQVLLKAFWQQIPIYATCNFPALTVRPLMAQTTTLQQGYTRVGKQPPKNIPALSSYPL